MIGLGQTVFVWALVSVVAEAAQAQDKPAPPAPAERAEALKMIKEIFKEDYAKRTLFERQNLAKRLLGQAIESKDNPALQYVLLREAGDMAAEASDIATALVAVDELSKRFAVDTYGMKLETITRASKFAKTPAELRPHAVLLYKLIDPALAADDFDGADKLSAAAAQMSKSAQDLALATRCTSKKREIADFKARHEKVRKAQETLAQDPSDAAANLLVGQHLCISKGEWDLGLPLLAKSSDPTLAQLAEKDLSNPSEVPGQLAVGDAWWDLAGKDAAGAKDRFKERAGTWYLKVLPKLSGLNKTKVEKRLLECRMVALLKGTWTDVTDAKLFGLTGKPGDPVEVVGKPGSITTVKLQFPKGEYDGVTARITMDPTYKSTAFLIYEGPAALAAVIDPERAFFANMKGTGGGWNLDYTDNWTKESETSVTILLTGGEYVLFLNGKEKIRLKTTKTRIEHLGLEARNATVKFDQIKLRRAD